MFSVGLDDASESPSTKILIVDEGVNQRAFLKNLPV